MPNLPARLNVEQAAWVLNCQQHDIAILMSNRLLKPLGKPPPNGIKYFASMTVVELAKDEQWLSKATAMLSDHWHQKNLNKKHRAMHMTPGIERFSR